MSKLKECLEKYGIQWQISANCGDGWVPLIDQLFQDLIDLGWDKSLIQLKEKFGCLRVYIGVGTQEQFDRIHQAENQSAEICENCGKPGIQTKKNWWIKTLCPDCQG